MTKSEWACDTCLYNMYRRDFIGRDYCYCKMHNCGAIRFKARECTLHALHWECGEDDGMNAKECSEAVGRFVKREDEAWCDGFIEGWNANVCTVDGLLAMIEEHERRMASLASKLEDALAQLAEMTKGFDELADRMREGR